MFTITVSLVHACYGVFCTKLKAEPAIEADIDKSFWKHQHALLLGSKDMRIEWRSVEIADRHSFTIPCDVDILRTIISKVKNVKQLEMRRNSGFDEREEMIVVDAILNSDLQLSSITLKFWNFQYLQYRNNRDFYWPIKTLSQHLIQLIHRNIDTLLHVSIGSLQSFQLEFWKQFDASGLAIRLNSTGNCDSQTFATVFYPFLQAITKREVLPYCVHLNVNFTHRDRAKCALQRAYQSALINFTHRRNVRRMEINLHGIASVEMNDVAELIGSMTTYLLNMKELRMISWKFSHVQFDVMTMLPYFESIRMEKGLNFDRVVIDDKDSIRFENMAKQVKVNEVFVSALLSTELGITCT
uniref:FTH domain-containing protein n=1 Tax=Ascaris lumbricoides TaxID=6252 RepID=A0A0M3I6L8_ASCLU